MAEFSDIVSKVQQVVEVGTGAYTAVVGTQTDKLKEKAAIEQSKPAALPPAASTVTVQPAAAPFYKAKWFAPAVAGSVLLIGLLFVLFRRKR